MARSLIPFSTDLPRPLNRLRQEMDRLFDSMFFPETTMEPGEMLVPPHLNVAETEKQYEVTVELPGMDAKDINIEFRDGDLCISGETKREEEHDGKTYHRIERHYGRFCRRLSLASGVDQDKVQAEYKQGILKVTVPKSAAAMPKRIEVKTD